PTSWLGLLRYPALSVDDLLSTNGLSNAKKYSAAQTPSNTCVPGGASSVCWRTRWLAFSATHSLVRVPQGVLALQEFFCRQHRGELAMQIHSRHRRDCFRLDARSVLHVPVEGVR